MPSKFSREVFFALLSVPFIFLILADQMLTISFLRHAQATKVYQLLTDLVFLNAVHVVFSIFFFIKIKEFRYIYEGVNLPIVIISLFLIAASLVLSGKNEVVVNVLASIHAYLQSVGIFLLYFSKKNMRKLIKRGSWFFLALVLLMKPGFIQIDQIWFMSLGVLSFLMYSVCSTSLVGLIFSLRFLLWFAPFSQAATSVGAIHGLEYLLVTLILWKATKPQLNKSDLLWALPLLSIIVGFLVSDFLGYSFVPLTVLFFFIIYGHYFFDSYVFRFSFQRQKLSILPLFTK